MAEQASNNEVGEETRSKKTPAPKRKKKAGKKKSIEKMCVNPSFPSRLQLNKKEASGPWSKSSQKA